MTMLMLNSLLLGDGGKLGAVALLKQRLFQFMRGKDEKLLAIVISDIAATPHSSC